ncbi:MAG: hypothetical protein LBS97_00590 [Treponema sp.]|jgi:hypothetical protein|nr:hypothetical protein [Treponema sp.]
MSLNTIKDQKEGVAVEIGGVKYLHTHDQKYSRSIYLEFAGQTVGDLKTEEPYHGDFPYNGMTVRFREGKLDGGVDEEGEGQPAVDADTHIEWWRDGKLHRDPEWGIGEDENTDLPAVTGDGGRWKEFWRDGVLLGIESTRLDIIEYPYGKPKAAGA